MSRKRLRAFVTVVFAGVCASFVLAGGGGATLPAQGVGCQADGGISGRGATFAILAQETLSQGYRDDVCGAVTTGSSQNNGVGTMVDYNYQISGAVSLTGSGAGRIAAACRSDAFGGTDQPYTVAQLNTFNGTVLAPINTATFNCNALQSVLLPPFNPKPAPWPDNVASGTPVDTPAPIMSFPITGGSVAIIVNLPIVASCATPPSTLQFTTAMVTKLYGGDILNWNDARLRANNPDTGTPLNASLATCNLAVTRAVRQDSSGTTQIFKNYLKGGDSLRNLGGAATCDANVSNNWTTLAQDASNRLWPGDDLAPATAGTCSAFVRGAVSGNPSLLDRCDDVAGTICYSDVAEAIAQAGSNPNLKLASARNAPNTAFVTPDDGTKSNCDFGALTLPGFDPSGAIGLDTGDSWAIDNSNGFRGDAGFKGNGWPACGLTWALVYTGLSDTDDAAGDPINRLNDNQRRTLYSYYTYVLGSAAQERLDLAYYASLPPSWVSLFRGAFQANF